MSDTLGDHPHTDPGDGRQECEVCGKWVWLVTHSCKGVPATPAAWDRRDAGRTPGLQVVRPPTISTDWIQASSELAAAITAAGPRKDEALSHAYAHAVSMLTTEQIRKITAAVKETFA